MAPDVSLEVGAILLSLPAIPTIKGEKMQNGSYSPIFASTTRKLQMRTLALLITVAIINFVNAQISFVDVTSGSGIDYRGKTYGSSWGDINGDGLMDIYVSCHYNIFDDPLGYFYVNDFPRIYINEGDGHFSDSIYVIDPTQGNDLHGALIFDFDNDGDNDLLITSGGSAMNLFYVNDNSTSFALNNMSQEYNIDFDGSRGRMPSVLDLDHNGVPDVVLSNQENSDNAEPTSVFIREDGGIFELYNDQAGFDVPLASHGTLMDMDNDGKSEFVMLTGNQLKIYDVQTGVFNEAGAINIASSTTDYVMGDFNGDLKTDVFFTEARKQASYMSQVDTNRIQADIQIGPSVVGSTYFMFSSADSIEITIRARRANEYDYMLHLGSDTIRHVTNYVDYVIHPNEAMYQGIQEIEADQVNTHVFIGRVEGQWKVQASNQTFNGELGIAITAKSAITDFQPVLTNFGGATLNNLNINNGGFGFTQVPVPGLQETDNCQMGVTGDFDNDMDLDIYVLCSNGATNQPNYLLENIDNQSWVRHDDGGGATGDGAGIGDAVTVADYDNDGFLDLFVSNGYSLFFLDSAKYNLYRNQGNANHWLGLNLIGATDTRGGYGAVVYSVAGGMKQVRTQNGGEHHRSQNDQRIHFGMGGNTVVDSVIVIWPCGVVQTLVDVPVDQYLDVHEPSCTVGVPEAPTTDDYLTIAPNPAQQSFSILSDYKGDADIRIRDISGKLVDEFTARLQGAGGKLIHPVSLVPGMYTLEFLPQVGSGKFHRTLKLMVR